MKNKRIIKKKKKIHIFESCRTNLKRKEGQENKDRSRPPPDGYEEGREADRGRNMNIRKGNDAKGK